MKPLGALKYFIENKRKACTIFITLLLAVFSISLITSMIQSIFSTAEEANIAPLRRLSVASAPNGSLFFDDAAVTKIEKFGHVDSVYSAVVNGTSIDTIFGNTSAYVVFIDDEKQFGEVFEKNGLTMKEGRFPKAGEYEVIMHENMLKNKKLSVGDEFGSEVDTNEWINGRYKIVGSFTGESVIAFATKNFYLNGLNESGVDTKTHKMDLVVFPKDGDLGALNKELDTLTNKEATVTTAATIERLFDKQMSSINSVMSVIIILVTFAMSVSVGALIYTIYSARNDEFGILYAIGYKKKDVRNLIFKEILSISFLCWAVGYIASIGVLKIVDLCVFAKMGQSMSLFSVYGITYTLCVPLCVFLCAALPVIRKLSKTDLVSVIERRG